MKKKIRILLIMCLLAIICIQNPRLIIVSICVYLLILGYTYYINHDGEVKVDKDLQATIEAKEKNAQKIIYVKTL